MTRARGHPYPEAGRLIARALITDANLKDADMAIMPLLLSPVEALKNDGGNDINVISPLPCR
jgi:hypothetical protein